MQKDKKLTASIVVLLVGIVTMAAGAWFMFTRLSEKAILRDAEYLVEMGAWARTDAPGVIWRFTEIGKGKLTTNNGTNEYDFLWAIEDGTLKIETDWLYTMNDEYEYKVDRGAEKLVLDDAIEFRPAAE